MSAEIKNITISTLDGPRSVGAWIIADTSEVFAVRRRQYIFDGPPELTGDEWRFVLIHVPTGLAIANFIRRSFAEQTGAQLWQQVCRSRAWRGTDAEAIQRHIQRHKIGRWLVKRLRTERGD